MKIIINGYLGRLGRVIVRTAEEDGGFEIAAGIDMLPPPHAVAYTVYQNISDCDADADVLIDASSAEGIPRLLDYAVKRKIPLVICTTGLTGDMERQVAEATSSVPVFKSANMSLGVNLLLALLRKAASVLDESGFDIEIIEKHHNQKIDAPSGTALMMADAVNDELHNKFSYTTDRSDKREKRSRNEIGIHAIRGGTIVGEHSIIFAGRDEIIELSHTALSKEIFAVGALRAAEFIRGLPPGLYSMKDLMGY